MKDSFPLRLAAIGCGSRTQAYLGLAAAQPGRYQIVAAADPDTVRLKNVAKLSGNAGFRSFRDDRSILAEPRLADVMVIGTQDAQHADHAVAAMETGYHLLLEKPIGPNARDIERVREAAARHRRRVMVCHVLRYTPFYRKLKERVEEGCLGKLITLNAVEGVDPWHHAHSFVRGHWSNTRTSSPMILAKSCHDLDIIRWLAGAPCRSLSSHGENSFFNKAHKPEGAPAYCHEGCPVGERCFYNAARYLGNQQGWLRHIMSGAAEATREEQQAWLAESPWGRCVYQCENDTVDHQTVNMEFVNGVTATFTMTAFETGRSIQLYGTQGRLRGGEAVYRDTGSWFIHEPHEGPAQPIEIAIPEGADAGHLGGDEGLVEALFREMTGPPESMTSPLETSVESHLMALAAEESRLAGRTVHL